jgi:hypothetical protein
LGNGKYEEQKDHSFGKRSLGFLLLFVLAAEKGERFGGFNTITSDEPFYVQ